MDSIAALLADRQHLRLMLADRLEETALAAEERRLVVAWLRAYADEHMNSYGTQERPLDEAADAIEAGRHARPERGET